MEYKIGQPVYEYSLEIFQDGKVKKEKTEHKIVAIEEHDKRGHVIAITDSYYGIEILQTSNDKDKLSTTINKAMAWERKWNYKGSIDSIQACIYSTQKEDKKVYAKLKKEIEKFLDKEYRKYSSYKILLENIYI